MKYELTEIEEKNLQKFLKKLPKEFKNKGYDIIFSNGSGIGIGVAVRVGDIEKDITDYKNW